MPQVIRKWNKSKRPGLPGWWWSSECPRCGQIVGYLVREIHADGTSTGHGAFNVRRSLHGYHQEPHRCVQVRGAKFRGLPSRAAVL